MRYAQVFTSGEGLSLTFGMHQKYEEAYHGLTHLIQKWVIPWTLVTDNAFEETKGKWGEICNEALIEQKCTEPYSPWQNIAETEIKELKKEWGMMRAKFKIPAALWCVGLEHLSKLRMKRSSHMTLNGEGRTTFTHRQEGYHGGPPFYRFQSGPHHSSQCSRKVGRIR
jgi:hypothetical protein